MPALRRKRSVRVHNGHPRLRINIRAVAAVIHVLDDAFGKTKTNKAKRSATKLKPKTAASTESLVLEGELSIAFLTDVALARLHATFLDDPSPTDVITFEGAPHLQQAGEICVSADTAKKYASQHNHLFSEELTLYLVHGWLHLAGYDDLVPAKKKRMRAAEAKAMKLLHAAKKIPTFTMVG